MAKEKSPLDQMLDDLLKGKSPKEILGQHGLLDELTKRLVERALEGEMTAHLGYEKHASEGRNRKNSRNGRATKRVKTSTSEIDVEVPRDREGSFEPQLLPKRRRRLPGFDEKVLALYARGLTTRDIQGHLKEMYGVNVSPSLISAVTDSVMEDVAAWQSRPLDVVYPIVYLDALHIKVRENRHVQPCAVYVALGIGIDGENTGATSSFLDYPAELRRAIYTTNAIESVQAQLRKVTKKHGAFPTKDSALKVLYLALMRAQQRWTMPIWNWPPVLDHLAIVFPGRVPGR
jgi:transposase-like protein